MKNSDANKTNYIRESFITQGKVIDNSMRPEILESWIRSRNYGINPRTPVLPDFITEQEASILRNDRSFRTESVKLFSQKLYKLLEDTDSVIFYTDENLTIIIQRGNERLLEKLNSSHLRIGTNFNENRVGTNALGLSALKNSTCSVVGAEHYIDALQDYACCAVPMIDIDTNITYGYAMFLTLESNYNPYQFATFEYFILLTRFNLDLQLQSSELALYNKLLTQSVEQQDKGLIFVDKNGFILKVNPWIRDNLERGIRGEKFLSSFPELSEAMKCMQTGKPIPLHEVSINKLPTKNITFFMECYPIKKETHVDGMIVGLFNKKQIHKSLSKIYNLNAHFVFEDLIGLSKNFLNVKTSAQKAALSPSNILITGESGTGKELFAQAIHNASNRKNRPFISINCAAIPRELIGSELFGYYEGAFTGARKGGAPGKFELADKGTIFLDEIGEMPLDMQSVLLKVLEDKMVTRLGGSYPVPIDVKVISATNKKLWESVVSNEFRLDLYYRLNVINLEVPPLRERREDVPLLINYFVEHFKQLLNKPITGVTPEAVGLLKNYDLPGNVRELRNIIERGINQCNSNILDVNDLPKEISYPYSQIRQSNPYANEYDFTSQKLDQKISKLMTEKEKILNLLEKYNGNKTLVAKELGISRVTLYNKLR